MIPSIPIISGVLIAALAALLGYSMGRRAGRRQRGEISQSQHDCCGCATARCSGIPADGFGRGLADAIATQFAMMIRYKTGFAIVIFDIDNLEQMGKEQSDRALGDVDRLLADAVRETDAVVRHGGNLFFVLMPRTDLMGASESGERFRQVIADGSSVTVSGGIGTALDGDSPGLLVNRASEALANAKRSGGNCVFRHDGRQVESVLELVPAGDSADDSASS